MKIPFEKFKLHYSNDEIFYNIYVTGNLPENYLKILDKTDNKGSNMLHYLAMSGNKDFLQYINQFPLSNNHGDTVFHYYALSYDEDTIEKLHDYFNFLKDFFNYENNYGDKPYHYILKRGSIKLYDILDDDEKYDYNHFLYENVNEYNIDYIKNIFNESLECSNIIKSDNIELFKYVIDTYSKDLLLKYSYIHEFMKELKKNISYISDKTLLDLYMYVLLPKNHCFNHQCIFEELKKRNIPTPCKSEISSFNEYNSIFNKYFSKIKDLNQNIN